MQLVIVGFSVCQLVAVVYAGSCLWWAGVGVALCCYLVCLGNNLLQCNLVLFLYFVRFSVSDPQGLQRLCENVLRLVEDVILDEKPKLWERYSCARMLHS